MESEDYFLCTEEEDNLLTYFIKYRNKIKELEDIFQVINPYSEYYRHIYVLFRLIQCRKIEFGSYPVPKNIVDSITNEEIKNLAKYTVDGETEKHLFLKAIVIKVMKKDYVLEFDFREDYLTKGIRFDIISKDEKIGVECGLTRVSKFIEGFTLVDEMWYIPYPKKGEQHHIYQFKFREDKEVLKRKLKEYIDSKQRVMMSVERVTEISKKLEGKW